MSERSQRGWPGAWADLALIGIAFVAGLVWSWNRWADPIIDFGQQLYVAWQLSEGRSFFTDVSYYYGGPLSPHLNAALFKFAGVSMRTLVFANIAVTAGVLVLLYRLLADLGGRLAATSACLLFLPFSVLPQLSRVGNFNFITPYTHEVTHAFALSLGAIACLGRYLVARDRRWLVATGLLAGLTLLTKPEVVVAVIPALSLGVVLGALSAGSRRATSQDLATYAAAVALPSLASIGLLALELPFGDAVRATAGSWPLVFAGTVTELAIFQWGQGVADVSASLKAMALASLAWLAIIGPAFALDRYLRVTGHLRLGLALAFGFGTLAALLGLVDRMFWMDVLRPLPLAMVLAFLWALVWLRRAWRHGPSARRRPILLATWAVFSLGMLAKIVLNARYYHYGFALAAPGTLLVVVGLVRGLPLLAARGDGSGGRITCAVGLAVIAALGVEIVTQSHPWLRSKTVAVGTGANEMLVDKRRGPVLVRTLAEIEKRVPADATLAVFPEGAQLNFWSGRPNPTRYMNFVPPEFAVFGEDQILDALRATPPDWIAIVHRPTREYGMLFFGRDYGKLVWAWIQSNYVSAVTLGAKPLVSRRFGIELLERVPRVESPPPGQER